MNIQKFKGKYFGENKIKKISLSKEKTYLGKEKVVLSFEGLPDKVYPLEMVNAVASDKIIDLTELRERKVKPILKNLLAVLLESELVSADIGYLTGSKLIATLETLRDTAEDILWGKDISEITLMDVEKILKKNKKI